MCPIIFNCFCFLINWLIKNIIYVHFIKKQALLACWDIFGKSYNAEVEMDSGILNLQNKILHFYDSFQSSKSERGLFSITKLILNTFKNLPETLLNIYILIVLFCPSLNLFYISQKSQNHVKHDDFFLKSGSHFSSLI